MKRKINKVIATIMLLIILINSLPLHVFAKYITDMDSNAFFGVIPNSYEDYYHEMHYCNYDGADYMLFCAEYNKPSVVNEEYVLNSEFWIEQKEYHAEYATIAEMICFGYTMKYGTGLPGSIEAQRAAACTQQYVWEYIKNNIDRNAKNPPARNSWNPVLMSESLYNTWLSETEGYYNQYHSGNVSFDNGSCNLKAGENTTITDTNNKLSSFDEFNTTINGVTFSHSSGSNDMTISANENTSGRIDFLSNENDVYQLLPNGRRFNRNTMSSYLYFQFNSPVVQNLIYSDYVDPIFFNYSVDVEEAKGNVKIKKINSLGNPVANCTFELYSDASCTNKVFTGTTNSSGEILFENIKTGKFWVKEVSVPNGYILNTSVKEVTIQRNQTATVEFTNAEPTGKIIACKVNENGDKITGVEITIEANETITNKAGTKIYYNKGDIVDTLTTDSTGKIEKSGLPLR